MRYVDADKHAVIYEIVAIGPSGENLFHSHRSRGIFFDPYSGYVVYRIIPRPADVVAPDEASEIVFATDGLNGLIAIYSTQTTNNFFESVGCLLRGYFSWKRIRSTLIVNGAETSG